MTFKKRGNCDIFEQILEYFSKDNKTYNRYSTFFSTNQTLAEAKIKHFFRHSQCHGYFSTF